MHLALKLELLRCIHRKSHKEIGELVHTKGRNYGYWEKGTYRIPPRAIEILADYYQVAIDWLTDEDDNFTLLTEIDSQGNIRVVPVCALPMVEAAPPPPHALHEIKEMLCLVVDCLTKPARSRKERSSTRKATKRKKRGAQKK